MGLDMYLNKKIYVGAHHKHNNVVAKIEIIKDGKVLPIDGTKISEVIERAGYWRKANHIHNWFVENVQSGEDNCQPYDVSRDTLLELLNLCKDITADNTKAQTLLPTTGGFFFGGTDYDEYYFDSLKETVTMLEALDLTSENYDVEYEYQSSW